MTCRAAHFDWPRVGAGDAVAESERRRLIEHIRLCEECRRRAVALDPTLVFATLAAPETGEREVMAMSERVAAARKLVDEARRESLAMRGREWLRTSPIVRPAAALAAGVALMAVVSGLGVGVRGKLPESTYGNERALAGAVSERIDAVVEEHVAREPLVEGSQEVRLSVEGNGFDVVLLLDSELELGGP